MTEVIGLHWAGKGWFGAVVEGDQWSYDLYPSVWNAWRHHQQASLFLLTLPVGLPSTSGGRRECDEAAKGLLGPRHPSVFYAPVRSAVYELSLPAAKEHNESAGFGIQNQAWSVAPRIREVDEFLAAHPDARSRFRETHPEVCFHTLAGRELANRRNTEAGVAERIAILEDVAPDSRETATEAIETLTTPRYAPLVTEPADVLDAFVAAVTARRYPDVPTVPMNPPTDERGLPMAILYPGDARQLTLGDIDT